ncbi:MAG: hypothetical protein KDA92_12045 [Planctomycetales bacterium]|nr:hypothetical protein [Planctomycetales bacterium]
MNFGKQIVLVLARHIIAAACCCLWTVAPLRGEELKSTVVAGKLATPWGVAVQLSTNTVHVAESGRGRIVRVVDGELQEVVVGIPISPDPQSPTRQLSAMALSFITPSDLLVGLASERPNVAGIYVVAVPSGDEPAVAWERAIKLTPDVRITEGAKFWLGVPSIMASLESGILGLTTQWPEQNSTLLSIAITQPERLNHARSYRRPTRHSLPNFENVTELQPVALTSGERGERVVGYARSSGTPAAPTGALRFLRGTDGDVLLELTLDVPQLTALQLVPGGAANFGGATLLALDFGTPEQTGGIYRIDAALEKGRLVAHTVRLGECARPVAFTVGSQEEAALYVSSWGPADAAAGDATGQLLRFSLAPTSK